MVIQQCIDTGVSRADVEDYLKSIGYWDDGDLRSRNAYVLSPSAYLARKDQRTQLEFLAQATYRAVAKLNAELCRIGTQTSMTHSEAAFYRLAKQGTKNLLSPRDGCSDIPPVIKADLVQDGDGFMHIAEVDVYNPRGFGFLSFLDDSIPQGLSSLGHGIEGLGEYMYMLQREREAEWLIIVSEFERYYEPAFRILSAGLAGFGIRTKVVREAELAESFDGNAQTHVFIIPESLDAHPTLRERLISAYRAGKLVTVYPPVAYLGSKALLPHLATLEGMQGYIPPCELVGRREKPNGVCLDKPTVLKAAVSSGMKKVIFSDLEPERFRVTYDQAKSAKVPTWILQQQVRQVPVPIVVFDELGRRETREFYLRITAYITKRGLLGAEVTGRPDRMVHGAPDCIQIPCASA